MKFSIIVTSDLHGEYSRFRTIASEIKKRKPDLLIDNGDFLEGSLLQHYYRKHPAAPHPMIQLANELSYDAAVFGNHEFTAPIEEIRKLQEQFHFPWISSNIEGFAAPYIIKQVKGVKIAVLGVTTHHTPCWDEQGSLSTLRFTEAAAAAEKWVSFIKETEQPDFLMISYHGGFAKDPDGQWIFDEGTGENEAAAMLEIDGVDLLVTGHQHLCLQGSRFGTHYIQPGSHGRYFAEIQAVQTSGHWEISSTIIPVKTEEACPPEAVHWLEEPIGWIPFDLTYASQLEVIKNGHAYADWFHQFQLEAAGAELSAAELFIHGKGGFKGLITRKDILLNYPRSNKLVTLELTGEAISAGLEQCAAVLALNEHKEADYAYHVYPHTLQPYQYDHWGGLELDRDLTKSVGSRISNITIRGERLDKNRTYTVAMNSYRALGNPPFSMYRGARMIKHSAAAIPALLEDYVRTHYPLPQNES